MPESESREKEAPQKPKRTRRKKADPTPSVNGQADGQHEFNEPEQATPKKPTRKPRKRHKPPPTVAAEKTSEQPSEPKTASEQPSESLPEPALPPWQKYGQLASETRDRKVEWFFQPYIPLGMLTLIVGWFSTGKSTFLAYLLSRARRALLMAGFEEPFESLAKPRLIANGVNLDNILMLKGKEWKLPYSRDRLIEVTRSFNADVICMDPISSYLPDGGNENNGDFVRTTLEAANQVGEVTGAAFVGIRHPGKDASNVMVGSREWSNVPRNIAELVKDDGPPERRIIRLYKDGLGQGPPARYFNLVGAEKEPRVFTLGEAVAQGAIETLKHDRDPAERRKVDRVGEWLKRLLADGEKAVPDIYFMAKQNGIFPRTLERAAQKIGVKYRHTGFGKASAHYWSLPSTALDQVPLASLPDKEGGV